MRGATLSAALLLSVSSVCASQQPPKASSAPEGSASCKLDALPDGVRAQLEQELGKWKVQDSDNLTPTAKGRWADERPMRCPGIAVGKFENGPSPVYALLLVPRARTAAGYRLLFFRARDSAPGYEKLVVDESTDSPSQNFFIRSVDISKFFDAASRKKFNATAREAILFFDAGDSEYEVDVYYWANGKYSHDAVDY